MRSAKRFAYNWQNPPLRTRRINQPLDNFINTPRTIGERFHNDLAWLILSHERTITQAVVNIYRPSRSWLQYIFTYFNDDIQVPPLKRQSVVTHIKQLDRIDWRNFLSVRYEGEKIEAIRHLLRRLQHYLLAFKIDWLLINQRWLDG